MKRLLLIATLTLFASNATAKPIIQVCNPNQKCFDLQLTKYTKRHEKGIDRTVYFAKEIEFICTERKGNLYDCHYETKPRLIGINCKGFNAPIFGDNEDEFPQCKTIKPYR